jgi:carbonic anhydrase
VSLREELLGANEAYASSFGEGDFARPPRKRLAVLTCIDARIDPLRILGLAPGDANVLRNAGARVTQDALRSLVVSHALLGTRETFLVGHTDCGLEGVTNAELRAGMGARGLDASAVDFEPFADVEESVREGLRRIAASPLLAGVEASGWVYDVRTGRLREVAL